MRKSTGLVLLLILATTVPAFAATQGSGRKSVTSAGTAEALSATAQPFTELTVCADPDNNGQIAVGTTPVASATVPEGVFLEASECFTIVRAQGNGKLTLIKVDATVSGESVSYEWFYR